MWGRVLLRFLDGLKADVRQSTVPGQIPEGFHPQAVDRARDQGEKIRW